VIQALVGCKLLSSGGFRALSKIFRIISLSLSLVIEIPCRNTIRSWVQKIGYYELTRPKEVSDDWIIILDLSMQLGQDKILLIYGIRRKNLNFDRPLKCSDLETLRILFKKSWKSEDIKDVVKKLEEEIGTIIYAVADYGSEIKKGLEIAGLKHIYDITHAIAGITEKIFKDNKTYSELTNEMSKMRIDLSQTDVAHLIPLTQRKKSHYQNLKRISDYLGSFLKYVNEGRYRKKLKHRTEQLTWIQKYEPFVKELSELNQVIAEIEKILKNNGLSKLSATECLSILNRSQNQYVVILKTKLNLYFNEMLFFYPNATILCTSDIIESAFGKYKNYVSKDPMAGVTNMTLCLAAFTSSLKKESIRDALEKTKVADIQKWTKENIVITLQQMRCLALNPS